MNIYSLFDGMRIMREKNASVVWLRGKQYSVFGTKAIYESAWGHLSVQRISLDELSLSDLQMRCASAFLGQTYIYFLGDISKYLKQKRSALLSYIQAYNGPHVLVFWAETDSVDTLSACSWLIIDIPDFIDKKNAPYIVDALYGESASLHKLLNVVWRQSPQISLDVLHSAYMYALVIGNDYEACVQHYILPLLKPEHSLFTLSQYFFGKQKNEFYKQWSHISKQYAMPFWLSFWSDQLWRATLFVRYMHTNKRAEAQDIAKYRLPFTFTKTDWCHTNPDLVQAHHAYLCDVDFLAKNGGDDHWLELFFLRWFSTH